MKKTLFGIDNGTEMPQSFLTDHQVWDDYISSVWYTVVKSAHINKNDTVLEIGPGVSTKIGGALNLLDFQGTLYVLDALPNVLKALKPKYDDLLPKANIVWVEGSLNSFIKGNSKNIDVILGNHIFDDMLIFQSQHYKALEWSANYQLTPSDDLIKAWDTIKENSPLLSDIKSQVTSQIKDLINSFKPRICIFNQYPSATLNDHKMHSLNTEALDILNTLRLDLEHVAVKPSQIQQSLDTNINYQNKHIGQNILNAEHWFICKEK